MFVRQIKNEYVEEADTYQINVSSKSSFASQNWVRESLFEKIKKNKQKLTLDNVNYTLLKFAQGYRLMNVSTTQWIKHFVFYSNSFRDNTQNKTHSRIRNKCYNYPTGIAHVYFIKKSQNKTICSIFRHWLFDFMHFWCYIWDLYELMEFQYT